MTYDYECSHCGPFSAEQRISDPRLPRCPHCNTPDPKRLISDGSGGFVCRGPGWARDGYGFNPKRYE